MNRQVSHNKYLKYAVDNTSAIIAQNTLLVCTVSSHIETFLKWFWI
jgi:hypothetical protein